MRIDNETQPSPMHEELPLEVDRCWHCRPQIVLRVKY